MIRPWILETDASGLIVVVVNSLPNFVEAILGTVLLAGVLFSLRRRSNLEVLQTEDSKLFLAVLVIAGVFTIAQELNWFNHRPDNVIDPFDFLASFVGLIAMNRLLNRFGFLKNSSESSKPG